MMGSEADRARIFELNPDGSGQKAHAWGIGNAVSGSPFGRAPTNPG